VAATNVVSRTRGPESATAVRCEWLAMFADLPILYCSPKMELGVDIAELNAVTSVNVVLCLSIVKKDLKLFTYCI
jgi:hypothetical protein